MSNVKGEDRCKILSLILLQNILFLSGHINEDYHVDQDPDWI